MSVLIATGCSSGSAETPEPDPTGDSASITSATADAELLPCQSTILDDEDVPDDYEILLDTIALPTANSAPRALQAGRHEDTDPPSYFAKTGLLVRSGAAFDIEVENPRTAGVLWGSMAEYSETISSQGCPGETWIAFAGGFVVEEPTCIRLTLIVDDQQ